MQAGGCTPVPAELCLDASESNIQSSNSASGPTAPVGLNALRSLQTTFVPRPLPPVPPKKIRPLPATPGTPQLFALPHDFLSVASGACFSLRFSPLGSADSYKRLFDSLCYALFREPK
jgi:hypothetical protein